MKSEAEKLRGQADTACYRGTTKREYGQESRKLLEEGQTDMYGVLMQKLKYFIFSGEQDAGGSEKRAKC